MDDQARPFEIRLARDEADIKAAQRLRYEVFVRELGGNGALVDHDQELERDMFDDHADHLLALDPARDGRLAGVYRLMRKDHARAAGRFYSESEYDLTPLLTSNRVLLELGRSCLHPDYRGGSVMFHMWQGLAEYVLEHEIGILFGTASFHGTDTDALAGPLSFLHHRHLAPEDLRVRAKKFTPMDKIAEDVLDRRAAMQAMPALIRAYLRLGGCVGDGAFVDHEFNTTDICLVMDTERMNDRQRALYVKGTS